MLGFTITLILVSLILMLQQYARHAVFSLGNIMFDLKQYSAWILALICYFTYKRWQKVPDLQ